MTVQLDGTEIDVDSRPSDAIALAIRAEAPIFAADQVIEESAIEFEGEEVNEEEIVSEFKRFLEDVSPDQFADAEEITSRRRSCGPAGSRRRSSARPTSARERTRATLGTPAPTGSRGSRTRGRKYIGYQRTQSQPTHLAVDVPAADRRVAGRPGRDVTSSTDRRDDEEVLSPC